MNRVIVLNTFAGAADVSTNNRVLKVTGLPDINFLDIISVGAGVVPCLIETVQTASVAFTAANDTTYSFQVGQYNRQLQRIVWDTVSYKSDSTGTAAEIAAGFVDYVNAKTSGGAWDLTASGSGTPVTIVGKAGNPLFFTRATQNVTITMGTTVAPHGTAGTALAGTTTVTVTTLAAHGLVVGQKVSITGATGYTFTRNGVASVAAIANAVIASVPTSSTFTLYGITGSGTNTGTITISVEAQEAFGNAAGVIASGAEATSVTGTAYAMLDIQYKSDLAAVNTLSQKQENRLTVWMNQDASNYATFRTTLITALSALSGGVSNPEILAVTG